MTVTDGSRVSIEYTLTLPDETQLDTNVGEEPLTYTQGGGSIPAALQEGLSGLEVGAVKRIVISPEQGFGQVDPAAFQEVDKTRIPDGACHVGTVLGLRDPDGHELQVRIHEINDTTAVLDLNHPLAGKTLVFDVKVVNIEGSSS
jgi:FKBP-type peptidyl-prolyl cis-trans isomerase SlyD